MSKNITLLAIIEITASLSVGVFILFITFKIVHWFGKVKCRMETPTVAYDILIASVLFSVGYVITGVIQPMITSFQIVSNSEENFVPVVLRFLKYSTIYVSIAYTLSILIAFIGVKIYSWLTPLDEFRELKNNNIGVGIIVGSIIIVLTLMSKSGIILLIEALVPYPALTTIN